MNLKLIIITQAIPFTLVVVELRVEREKTLTREVMIWSGITLGSIFPRTTECPKIDSRSSGPVGYIAG